MNFCKSPLFCPVEVSPLVGKTAKIIIASGVLAFFASTSIVLAQSCCVNEASTIITFAGTGQIGYSGDNGPAIQATLYPVSGCTDLSGNSYLLDTAYNVVRKVSTAGIITTFAGSVTYGFSGDGGAATQAQFRLGLISSVCADPAGNVYILDSGNNRIRRVDTSGAITTAVVLPNLSPGVAQDMAMDSSGNFIIGVFPNSGSSGDWLLKVSPLGAVVTLAGTGPAGYSGDNGPASVAMVNIPDAVTTDTAGNIYFDDSGNFRVRRIDTSGNISTYAGNGVYGHGGDGGLATQANIDDAPGLAYCAGNLYLSDPYGYLRVVSPSGAITTFAGNGMESDTGDGGPAILSTLNFPGALWLDPQNSLYTAENQSFFLNLPTGPVTLFEGNRVRKILSACIPTLTPTPTSTPTWTPSATPTPSVTTTPTATPSSTPTPLPCPPGYTGPNPPGPGTSFTYPAPATGDQVNFAYYMREAGSAQILVWNEGGDLAAECNQQQGCGPQKAVLNIRGFAVGVYYYQVRMKYDSGGNENVKTKKFVVLK